MNIEKNTIDLLSKLSQNENKSLRDAYERENKYLREKYKQKIKFLHDECEHEVKYLNYEYEQEIKSTDRYSEWIIELFYWDFQTILVSMSISTFLYLITIFYTENSPLIMFFICASIYLLVIPLILITISLDRKINVTLYLKAKIIYFFSYFHSHH
ncbi:hypothetical protein [Xenorhabdus bharatensis]|uniref:hypothetical protein n=1 Tax=Xenorhabdus bharatensis TaxID=3136256 RepID=UPI0030F3B282